MPNLATDNVSLPWGNIEDVTFESGEDINYTTVNKKILRLLENDLTIYKLKTNLERLSIIDYSYIQTGENGIVEEGDLVWLNSETPYSPAPSGYQSKINVVFPIIPKNLPVEQRKFPRPTKVPDELSAFHNYLETKLLSVQPINSYMTVLSCLQDFLLDKSIIKSLDLEDENDRPNVVRYDAGIFAFLNKEKNFEKYYEAGYRWIEALLTRDCLNEITAFTKNIIFPFITNSLEENTTTSLSGQYDLGIDFVGSQYLFVDNKPRLMTNYPEGNWIKTYGSNWVKQGGVATMRLESAANTFTKVSSSINFSKPFKKCFKINVQPYNNYTAAETSRATVSAQTFCPVYIETSDLSGFIIKAQPCYSGANMNKLNSKQYNEFNVVWEAEGII